MHRIKKPHWSIPFLVTAPPHAFSPIRFAIGSHLRLVNAMHLILHRGCCLLLLLSCRLPVIESFDRAEKQLCLDGLAIYAAQYALIVRRLKHSRPFFIYTFFQHSVLGLVAQSPSRLDDASRIPANFRHALADLCEGRFTLASQMDS